MFVELSAGKYSIFLSSAFYIRLFHMVLIIIYARWREREDEEERKYNLRTEELKRTISKHFPSPPSDSDDNKNDVNA